MLMALRGSATDWRSEVGLVERASVFGQTGNFAGLNVRWLRDGRMVCKGPCDHLSSGGKDQVQVGYGAPALYQKVLPGHGDPESTVLSSTTWLHGPALTVSVSPRISVAFSWPHTHTHTHAHAHSLYVQVGQIEQRKGSQCC